MMNSIKAVIWDMDGVIIDTEKFWPKAEREIFVKLGVPQNSDFENATTGLRTLDVIEYWYKKYPWDTNAHSFDEIKKSIIDQMIVFVTDEGEFMPCVAKVLHYFYTKNITQSIASSSPSKMITTVIDRLHISQYIDKISSGEDQKYGKPAPDVYLAAAKKIAVNPKECIAIEDSYNGALAAHRAGMHVFIVPEKSVFDNPDELQKFKNIENSTVLKDIRDLMNSSSLGSFLE